MLLCVYQFIQQGSEYVHSIKFSTSMKFSQGLSDPKYSEMNNLNERIFFYRIGYVGSPLKS